MLNRFKIGTRIGGGFALGLAMLTAIGIAAHRTTTNLIENSRWEKHTYQVLEQLKELNAQLVSAETGQRGYIITEQPLYLTPYNNARKAIEQDIENLRTLTADNPNQQRRLDVLEPLIEARLGRLQEGIRLRDQQGFEAARTFTRSDVGRQLMEQIRAVLEEMDDEERALLQQRSERTQAAAQQTLNTIVLGIPISFLFLTAVGFWLSRNISRPLQKLSDTAEKITAGDLSLELPSNLSDDEAGILTRAFNQMVRTLRETIARNEEQRWLKSNLADLSQSLQGERDLATVAQRVLSQLASLLEVQQGVFYTLDEAADPPVLKLLSSYAYQERKHLGNQFRLGEGLVGQAALEKQRILLTEVPGDYIRISSGLGEAPPLNIVVLPLLFETQVNGVIELASFRRFTPLQLTFLEDATTLIGVILNAIASYNQTQQLLEESQSLTEELRLQQEELLQSNQRLEEQTQSLQESEVILQQQQEELQQSNEELQQLNEELEEKAELLESQKQQTDRKNQEIERARQELEEKAEQLALSSKYKSEFLANMSHELRTPLNSLLILAKLLSDNSSNNLTEKQVEYSRTIYSAGTDLLSLINDILDLAKIESGTMTIDLQPIAFSDLQSNLDRTFREMAISKELTYSIRLDEALPATIVTDPKRLLQVLKNLLSNAFKFTEQGEVRVHIHPTANQAIAFTVADTGIGIPLEKQRIIFEAFQQVDGTTSRKYGGTGLGLSISLELAHLLGGTIDLVSNPGRGSTFTLTLPQSHSAQAALATSSPIATPHQEPSVVSGFVPSSEVSAPVPSSPVVQTVSAQNSSPVRGATLLPNTIEDDRAALPGDTGDRRDRVLLVIEDDLSFANILLDMARRQGFKVLIAPQGQAGLDLAQRYLPDAITLDLHLPDMEGWEVLDRLKRNFNTRHIPVHVMSVDDRQPREFYMGAIAHIQKPISPEILTQTLSGIKQFIERQVKHLLIIEDDPTQAQSIIELIGSGDVQSTAVRTGTAALEALRSQPFDCVILDLGLPDMTGFELIEQIKQEPSLSALPIIVYTGKELTLQEETHLRRLAETIIIKDVRSPERLLDETALFLHRVQSHLPSAKHEALDPLQRGDLTLANKKVLIVDDDMRNIFALASLLEQYHMEVVFAENGKAGIEVLQNNPDVSVILLDIMMPEMDGYQTTRLIRQQEQFRSLPIIALTAKAMQGDREKCIEAGASDYITKPVDTEQLLSLLRLWLYR